MPLNFGMFALPDMPVASTSCFGFRVTGWPSRSTCTVHSPVVSSKLADSHDVEPQ